MFYIVEIEEHVDESSRKTIVDIFSDMKYAEDYVEENYLHMKEVKNTATSRVYERWLEEDNLLILRQIYITEWEVSY